MRQRCYETCRLRDPFPAFFPSLQRQLVCNPVSNLYYSRKILSLAHRSWPCGHLLWFGRGLSTIDSCVLKLGFQMEGFSRTLWYVLGGGTSTEVGTGGWALCFLLHWDVIKVLLWPHPQSHMQYAPSTGSLKSWSRINPSSLKVLVLVFGNREKMYLIETQLLSHLPLRTSGVLRSTMRARILQIFFTY